MEPIDWRVFRTSIEESLCDRAAQAGMTIEFADGNVTRPLFANASALERIVVNLVDNACKYAADSEPPTVRVVARCHGDHVEIRVSDNGPGLSESARRRLFKPFSKSATEAAKTKHGVGLGLSLSRELARSLRGELVLEHSDASGTVFVLKCPAAD